MSKPKLVDPQPTTFCTACGRMGRAAPGLFRELSAMVEHTRRLRREFSGRGLFAPEMDRRLSAADAALKQAREGSP